MKPIFHRKFTLLGLCLASALCLQALPAQDATPAAPAQQGQQKHDRLPPGFERLNLTDAQKTAILKIMKDSRDKIDQVLTPDQKAQAEKFRSEHHFHGGPGGQGGQGGQGGNPPPPPPQ